MTTIQEALGNFLQSTGVERYQHFATVQAAPAFYAGAAAMAEICAGGSAAIAEELRQLRLYIESVERPADE
jgi:hypothetical protein